MSLLRPLAFVAAAAPFAAGCYEQPTPLTGIANFAVTITSVDGIPSTSPDFPSAANPLRPNYGGPDPLTGMCPNPGANVSCQEPWGFTVEARDPTGAPYPFNGMVNLSLLPGIVISASGPGADGANIMVTNGTVSGTALVSTMYGPTRLWVEDIGYDPAMSGTSPACSSGKPVVFDGTTYVDYPADPGCAYADSNNENGGTYAAGVSPPVQYALPKISDLHGHSSSTPYNYQAVDVKTSAPQNLVVTALTSQGFFVTDVDPAEQAAGYNSVFAYNFSTPAFMSVCYQLTYLAGTVDEFYNFLELDFPSYALNDVPAGTQCMVPEPTVITAETISNPVSMKKLESSLVRIQGYQMPVQFGPNLAVLAKDGVTWLFGPDQSNCDLNGDGKIEYTLPNGLADPEGLCDDQCATAVSCSEWTDFVSRTEFKVNSGGAQILVNLSAVPQYDPSAHVGGALDVVTGSLTHFSGGKLNWTVVARCPDDLVCKDAGCSAATQSSQTACVRAQTIDCNE
jgi:hypothetical protein